MRELASGMRRHNLTFYEARHPVMQNLREGFEAASDSESVRRAACILETMIQNHSEGTSLVIYPPRGAARYTLCFDVIRDRFRDSAGIGKRNLYLHDRTVARMTNAQEAIGLGSVSATLRRALLYADVLVTEEWRGSQIAYITAGMPPAYAYFIARPSMLKLAA